MSIKLNNRQSAFMAIDVQKIFCDAAYGEVEAEKIARRIAYIKPLFNLMGVQTYLFKAQSQALQIPPPALDLHLINPNAGDKVINKKPDYNSILADENFAETLREDGYNHFYVTGFNTAYCVQSSVIDARNQGFDVTVLSDCIGSVRAHPSYQIANAMKAMRKAGAKFATSDQVLSKLECI